MGSLRGLPGAASRSTTSSSPIWREFANSLRSIGISIPISPISRFSLAERLETLSVLTVDARDFSIYRLRSGKRLVNLLDERA
jgi:hypothetical protein